MLELTAIGFALAYLILTIKRHLFCWICAAISSILYLYLMVEAHLYMQTALQLFYLVMALYGWHEWKKHQNPNKNDLKIEKWPLKNHLIAILGIMILTGINGFLLNQVEHAHAPYLDAFVTWGSIVTTWMVTRRILENWIYWFIIDLSAAYLYYTQGLTSTALLFILYILMVIYGYFDWKRTTNPTRAHK